jgi:hypothetical protein
MFFATCLRVAASAKARQMTQMMAPHNHVD